ncbi:hypothetical protein BLNAU_23662 [Blattamonas nauphoetae]|uniref:Uncharacterized protein n=1 Tax=Blattamonas nauphoetae TaxID=2049346 RepID=A0ABQ9WPL2_9EUKA|nr:hypothetical protein BLNAU_23662 [Blattamonas nauphoetae]
MVEVASCVTNSSFPSMIASEKCAAGFGGALSLKITHSQLSNCAFVSCSSESWGGAMELQAQCRCLRRQWFQRYEFSVPRRLPLQQWKRSVSISGDSNSDSSSESSRERNDGDIKLDGSNVPRLVHIVFGSDSQISTTGSAVSSGANGVIPPADKYELRSSSIASDYFLPTSVQSAHSSLSVDGNTTTIVLNGIKLNEGSYSMLIRNKEKNTFNISLNRFNSTTLVGTAPLYPSTADGRLDWATEYQVAQVMWLPEGEQNDQSEPPRIESVARSLSGKKDLVIVELIGTKLTSAGQTVVISGSSGNISSRSDLQRDIGTIEDPTHVVFGGQYELLSVGTGSSSFAVNGGIFFTVPHPKITSIVPQTKVSSSSFLLSVSGENLPSGSTYLVTLTSDHTFNILFSSAIAGTATIQIGRSGEVEYDTEYTIKSIIRKEEGKDDEHILFSAATFKTPLGPTLSFISSSFHSSDPNFLNVSLTTARMPSEDLILTLETAQLPIETVHLAVSHSDVSTGFILVEVYGKTDTLKYGTEYSVVKMKSSSVVAVVTAQPFSTPDEPIRITAAACSLGGDNRSQHS